MTPSFISIPFKIDSPHGLSRVDGIAKFSGAGIVLEFEAKVLGMLKTGVKEVKIPLVEIIDIKLKSGMFDSKIERLFSTKIEIRLNNFKTVSEVPSQDGKIILVIKREDRERAEKAVQTIVEAQNPPTLPSENASIYELIEDETKRLNE